MVSRNKGKKFSSQHASAIKRRLHNALHLHSMASASAILASLISMHSYADQQLWLNGSAFDPAAHIARNLPVPSAALGDLDKWIQTGQIADAAGNPITSVEQFNQLLGGENNQILRIDQKSGKAILNWESFDINANFTVEFYQPSATSIALNRINASTSPSYILGNLTANGSVYLINPNGVVFGKDSRVDVGALVASSLDIDPELFLERPLGEILKNNDKAAFSWNGTDGATGKVLRFNDQGFLEENVFSDEDAAANPVRGDIAVLDGAEISSSNLNGVVMVAPNVLNEGHIETPGGQTLLAAVKDEAYVLFSNDPGLRGLLIEVKTGGNLTNLGDIIAERGNVTLAGVAVNHGGSIRATTSVDFNGTVRLLARDNALDPGNKINNVNQVSALLDPSLKTVVAVGEINPNNLRVSTHGGAVTLGENSRIDIQPESESNATAPDAQVQRRSGVEISASSIHLERNAQIEAKGGDVYLDAINNLNTAYDETGTFRLNLAVGDAAPARVVLESGAGIDVSGTQVALAMERNQIEVELRGNELADAPLQRDGFLQGKTVTVDIREGTPLADISPALAAVPKSIDERLVEGGNIRLRSEGELIVQSGTSLDVSGGGVHYNAGYINTTKLLDDGHAVDISEADPTREYDGILGQVSTTNERFNITDTYNNFFIDINRGKYVEAFDHGAAAGSVLIEGQAAFIQGDIHAGTRVGGYQRLPEQRPDGGRVTLDLNLQSIVVGQTTCDEFELDERLLAADAQRVTSLNPQGLYAQALSLSDAGLNSSGAGSITLKSRTGSITLDNSVNLQLADESLLQLVASEYIDIEGSIHTSGGNVIAETGNYAGGFAPQSHINLLNRPITLGESASIDTSARWINDNPLLNTHGDSSLPPVVVDAGSVRLSAKGDLQLIEGSQITANGGGWLDADGHLHAGKGGDISLSAVLIDSPVITEQIAAKLVLDGVLSSYAFEQGGALSLRAPSIYVGAVEVTDDTITANTLVLDEDFFNTGGFSAYNLTAQGSKNWVSEFEVAEFTDIDLTAQNYALGSSGADLSTDSVRVLLPTGTSLIDTLGTETLPDYARKSVDLTFKLVDTSDEFYHQGVGYRANHLNVGTGVRISADPQATIGMASNTFLIFDGIVDAKGGSINLSVSGGLSTGVADVANFDDAGIWLGQNAVLDVSSDFIQGLPTPDGLSDVGRVIDAGNIRLATERGFVIAESGSILDLSAEAYTTERWVSSTEGLGATKITDIQVARAGSLVLQAGEGVVLDADIDAHAGGASGGGGTFSLTLKAAAVPNVTEGSVFEQYDFSQFSFADRQIVISQSKADGSSLPDTLTRENFGQVDAVPEAMNARAELSLEQLMSAGFDAYSLTTEFTARPKVEQLAAFHHPDPEINNALKAEALAASGVGKIVFDGDVTFVADKSIELNTTTLVADEGRAVVAAPYIRLGYSDNSLAGLNRANFTPDRATGGSGELVVVATNFAGSTLPSSTTPVALHSYFATLDTSELLLGANHPDAGGLLDIVGRNAVQGADQVTLVSAGDIRTRGFLVGEGRGDFARYLGSLTVNKDLTLQADQIYPTTLSEFLFASGQRDFSVTGETIKEPVLGGLREWDLVNTHELVVEFTNAATGEKTTETLSPTWYEAYDLLSGNLQVGGRIYRQSSRNNSPIDEGVVLSVSETAIAGSADGKIRILAGSTSSPVLSAGGSLIIDAPAIEQSGVLKAPFGQITFNARTNESNASGQVIVKEGSLTSVSAENQIIPFGEIDSADNLIYRTNPSLEFNSQRLFTQALAGRVTIQADDIDLQAGSRIDLAGGGDLLAARFVPGPGGSKDVLAPANAGSSFAIIPALNSAYAPFDPSIYHEVGSTAAVNNPGTSVYLSGVGDLPAGEYSILPARYALLPGAYLVTPLQDGKVYSASQDLYQLDGTPIAAGRYTTANTLEQDSLMSGFVVEPGTIARTRSEYIVTLATELFAPTATGTLANPNDAGSLVLFAGETLALNSDITATVGKGGIGAQLDVVSEHLEVVNQLSGNNPDTVQLLADQLNTGGFSSVLLGGVRSRETSDLSIRAGAQSVNIAEDVTLALPELMLVATGNEQGRGNITLQEGAHLTSKASAVPKSGATTNVNFLGDSFLRVSTTGQFNISQSSNSLGDISIHEGAVTEATGSQLVLSNGNTSLEGDLIMQGGSLAIGSGRISLGDVQGEVDGLKFTNSDLAALAADEIILSSSSSIDLYGSLAFTAENIVLKAGALLGFGDENTTATITANDSLKFVGLDNAYIADASPTGAGNVILTAPEIVLSDGNWAMDGFTQVTFAADEGVVGEGNSQLDIYSNNIFEIKTPLLTGTGAANTTINSAGQLIVTATETNNSTNPVANSTGLGARLTLSGDSITYGGNTLLPSGQLHLIANGAVDSDARITSAADINLAGKNIHFADQTFASYGGLLSIKSASGDVVVDQGAIINLSGVSGTKGSDAGQLRISALAGEFQWQGDVIAESGTHNHGASFDLSVFSISDFSDLLRKVTAGNFTESLSFRTGSGDFNLAVNDHIKARHISLTADAGAIVVAGTLEATGVNGTADSNTKRIQLSAMQDVHLQSTAQLLAMANTVTTNNPTPKAGDISLSTISGVLQFDAGAKIDVSGGGHVTLRAPRLQAGEALTDHNVGDDVAVNLPQSVYLNDVIIGAGRVDVNAVKIYAVAQNTSEIFNTTANGDSTLSVAIATLPYRVPVPFGAVCENASGCNLIESTTVNSGVVTPQFITITYGTNLPVGYLCGDASGCSYSYSFNKEGDSIANVETQEFMLHSQAIEARLFGEFSIEDNFHLQPELELQSQGDLVVDATIDFGRGLGVVQYDENGTAFVDHDLQGSHWRFNDTDIQETTYLGDFTRKAHGDAGVLSLRAVGGIHIDAAITDGFTEQTSLEQAAATQFTDDLRVELTDEAQGWSYQLVAGAALDSADIFATNLSGNLQINENLFIRTGVGSIALVSANDMQVGSKSSIYTAGRATGNGIYSELALRDGFDTFDFSGMSNVVYANAGGDVSIRTGGNLTAIGEQQFVTDWLHRMGNDDVANTRLAGLGISGVLPTTWAVSPDDFIQGVGTLGGGDINIHVGKTINNLSVSLPTTGKNVASISPMLDNSINDQLLIQGGGDLVMIAGQDVIGAQVFMGRGDATIQAGGDISGGQQGNNTLLELADGQIMLSAAGDINIANIVNPTAARFSAQQAGTELPSLELLDLQANTGGNNKNYFFTYAADAGVSATSLSGDVIFSGAQQSGFTPNQASFVGNGEESLVITNVFAPQLSVNALQGDIRFEGAGAINLYPSAQGKLSLLAANHLTAETGTIINLPDVNPENLPSIFSVAQENPLNILPVLNLASPADTASLLNLMHASTPLYLFNNDPVKIIAAQGDITNLRLVSPTVTRVTAGRDIRNVTFEIQHLHADDISVISAGRDIVFVTPRDPSTNALDFLSSTQGIDIAGMGRLDVIAGGNIELGASRGIQSIGAANNPNLLQHGFSEEAGADISLFAGIKGAINYAGFIDTYLAPFALTSFTSTEQLITYLKTYTPSTRVEAEQFVKSVSKITNKDYYSGAKSNTLNDQQIFAVLDEVQIELATLDPVIQQQIAFQVTSSRLDNYGGDLIEFVTSDRFGENHLDAETLLALPLADQHQTALTAFRAAPVEIQRELLLHVYFNEVRQGGVQDVSGLIEDPERDGFARSYAAIEALFPQSTKDDVDPAQYSGNISLVFSTVQTQQGGDINLIAPGGSIDVGVAALGGGVTKPSSSLGLIALRSGYINATVNDNINVNSSRVFALDGGDISLWSSYGDLDAGRGAKTALSVPPPIVNADGSINFQAAVAGSGIRNSRFTANRAPGAVYLFAPDGVVNAGDAGIGSQGDVLIAAQQVIGADNIDVGGISIGVPVATGISAGLAGISASATAAGDATTDELLEKDLSAAVDQRRPAFVTIDILGLDF